MYPGAARHRSVCVVRAAEATALAARRTVHVVACAVAEQAFSRPGWRGLTQVAESSKAFAVATGSPSVGLRHAFAVAEPAIH
jgi:hypothetical protein